MVQMELKVASVQLQPYLCDLTGNIDQLCALVERTMAQDAAIKLIVFPELATSGYECGPEFTRLAEDPENGESMRRLGALARRYRTNIVYGFPEKGRDGALYNAAVLLNAAGEVAGVYRKVHLYGPEADSFRPGDSYPVIATDFGKVGIMICYDAQFPEVARSYALQGADLLVVPANWEEPYIYDWDLALAARAFDNLRPLVAANRIGKDQDFTFFGRSKVLDALGRPLAQSAAPVEEIVTAVIDFNAVRQVQREYTYFQDRRPETYGFLTHRD